MTTSLLDKEKTTQKERAFRDPWGRFESLCVSEARTKLPSIIDQLENDPGLTVVIERHNMPEIACLSYGSLIKLIEEKSPNTLVAELVVEKALHSIPSHIASPAIKELSALSSSDLAALYGCVYSESFKHKDLQKIQECIKDPLPVKRLMKRYEIGKALLEAEREGLFEASESYSMSHSLA